jgi:excisionase family DNA binding protein
MSKKPAPLAPLDVAQRYTVDEAIRYLRSSRATVYKLIAAGKLKTISEGKRRYCPGAEIARLSSVQAA